MDLDFEQLTNLGIYRFYESSSIYVLYSHEGEAGMDILELTKND